MKRFGFKNHRTFLLLMVLLFGNGAMAKSYYFASIFQEVFVQDDGKILVEDSREYVFDGQYKHAFLDIKPKAGGTIKFLGVEATDGKAPTNPVIAGTKITWDSPANSEHRIFKISYVLTGELQTATDASLLDRRILEDSHMAVNNYKLNIHVPKPAGARNHRLFVFTSFGRIGTMKFDAVGKLATVALAPLRENEAVRAKLILTTPIGKQNISGKRFEQWLSETSNQTKSFRDASKQATSPPPSTGSTPSNNSLPAIPPSPTPLWLFLLPWGIVAFLLERLAWVYQKFGREPKVQDIGKYFREPAENIPPGAVPFVMTQGMPNTSAISQGISATLLDFARRGIVELLSEDKQGFFGKHKETSFKLLKAPESTSPDFEQELWQALTGCADQQKIVTTKALQNYSKTVNGFANTWAEYPRQWYELHKGQLLESSTPTLAWLFAGLALLMGISGILLGFISLANGNTVAALGKNFNLMPLAISALLGGLLLLVGGIATIVAMPRWVPEKLLNANKWSAYKNFLADFSQLEKAPAEHYKLWDYHFVYAAALGVADKYLANIGQLMQRDPSQFGAATWLGYNNYGNTYGSSRGNPNLLTAINSLEDISNNLRSLESSLNAQEARSDSGFSGGFGGSDMGGSSGDGGSSGAE